MAVPRHEAPKHMHPLFVCMLTVILCTSMSLGGIRLYSLHLEQRISELNQKIDKYTDYNAELERKLSSLLSPGRIYNTAKANMGMSPPPDERIILVKVRPPVGANALDGTREAKNDSRLSRIFRMFIPGANAED